MKSHALIDYGRGPTQETERGTFFVTVYGADGEQLEYRYGTYRACIAFATRHGVDRWDVDLTPRAQRQAVYQPSSSEAPSKSPT